MQTVSIIIPCYNERYNIFDLYQKTGELFSSLNYTVELIFVDDGSSDGTWDAIHTLVVHSSKKINIKGIRFSRNFGHQAALEAGMNAATGDAIITIDADFQHPLEVIPLLLERWKLGYDIVNTHRIDSSRVPIFKRITGNLFYFLFSKISSVKLSPGSSDFRLLDAKVVSHILHMPERQKFFRGLVHWVGFKICSVSFKIRDRKHGNSGYTLKKMIHLARVGITSFSYLPMKLIILFGALLSLFSLIFFFIVLYFWFLTPGLFSGAALFGSFILFNNGLLITFFGIMAIYQMSMMEQIQGRPSYIVAETAGSFLKK